MNCSSFFVGLIGGWFHDNVMTVLLQALPLQQQPWQSRGGAPWRCLGRRISCASLWTRSRGFLPSWDVNDFQLMNINVYQCYKKRYESNLVFSVGIIWYDIFHGWVLLVIALQSVIRLFFSWILHQPPALLASICCQKSFLLAFNGLQNSDQCMQLLDDFNDTRIRIRQFPKNAVVSVSDYWDVTEVEKKWKEHAWKRKLKPPW